MNFNEQQYLVSSHVIYVMPLYNHNITFLSGRSTFSKILNYHWQSCNRLILLEYNELKDNTKLKGQKNTIACISEKIEVELC